MAYPPQVSVQDTFFNPISGLNVTFRLVSGGGFIRDSVQITDAKGVAKLGHWTFGPAAPLQQVGASVAGLPLYTITREGTPTSIDMVSGDSQTVNIGTYLKQPLVVRVFGPDGRPLAGFPVGFGGPFGIYFPPAEPSDSTGTVRSRLGNMGYEPGPHRVTATSFDLTVDFTLIGNVATPVRIEPMLQPAETFADNLIPFRPTFRVLDSVGEPVANTLVSFDPSDGGRIWTSIPTDGAGSGSVGAWRVGPKPGTQTLHPRIDDVPLDGVIATTVVPPPPPGRFSIDLRYTDTLLADSVRQAIREAADQWATAIAGDLPDIPLDLPALPGRCYPAMRETVDDLVIFVSVTQVDGPGGVLAMAGPCILRSGSSLPIVSVMHFDAADLEFLGKFRMRRVALHEIGHALGIGPLWEIKDLIVPVGFGLYDYVGTGALAGFTESRPLGGYPYTSLTVDRSHWSGIVGAELMLPYFSILNALTTVSLGGLRDLGYLVNDLSAEPFPSLSALRGPDRLESFGERIPDIQIWRADERGRIVGTATSGPTAPPRAGNAANR